MRKKYLIILFATVLSMIFTVLTYITANYAMLWLSLEVISLPVIYAIGYESMMEQQKSRYQEKITIIQTKTNQLDKKNFQLVVENKRLKSLLQNK